VRIIDGPIDWVIQHQSSNGRNKYFYTVDRILSSAVLQSLDRIVHDDGSSLFDSKDLRMAGITRLEIDSGLNRWDIIEKP